MPKDWTDTVRIAVLNVVCIVRIAMLAGRELLIREGDVADARIHRLETEVALPSSNACTKRSRLS